MTTQLERSEPKQSEEIGFIGLGVMGQPMALNLLRSGVPLVVWNRSPAGAEPLRNDGAFVAASIDDLFARTRIIICMLVNEEALDAVLDRNGPAFAGRAAGHIIVSMGSNSPGYSRELAKDIQSAGGHYVEAPVSGSRKPAEAGQLVALLGGEPAVIKEVQPLFEPMCRQTVFCGGIGHALSTKLAINLFLNTMLAGLAEAVHFASRHGLDLEAFRTAIESGPMSSDFTSVKLPKLISEEFSVQAATSDAFNSTNLIAAAAREAGIASPLLDVAQSLYGESVDLGNGRLDMVSVIRAIEARTASLSADEAREG